MIDETVRKLSKKLDDKHVQSKPGRGNSGRLAYISHGSITEALNERAPGWSTEAIRYEIHEVANAKGFVSPHCLAVTLAMTIEGVTRVETGCPANLGTLGDDMKNAHSDALKRCAMRFGLGLYLWEELVDTEHDEDYVPQSATSPAERSNAAKDTLRPVTPQTQQDTPVARAERPVPQSKTEANGMKVTSKQDPDDPNSVLPTKRREDMLAGIFNHTKGQITSTDCQNLLKLRSDNPDAVLPRITVVQSRDLWNYVMNSGEYELLSQRDELRRKYQPITDSLRKKFWAVVGQHSPEGMHTKKDSENWLHVQLFEHLGLGSVNDMSTYDVDKMVSVYEGQNFLDPAPEGEPEPPF